MSSLRDWVRRHPRLVAWVILAAVLIAVVAFDTRALGLRGARMLLLVLAALGVSAAAVWIVGWDRPSK
jgi:peptidoglycan/LPS O-acetylase OafA/YrhL